MDRQRVIEACMADGGQSLKPFYRKSWSPACPTAGFCYAMSEALYHYRYPELRAYVINLGARGTHWFLAESIEAARRGQVVDFTAEQFTDIDITLHYKDAKACGFFKGGIKTPRGWISMAGHRMAVGLGLVAQEA